MSDKRFSLKRLSPKLIPLAVVLELFVIAPELGLTQTYAYSVLSSFTGGADGNWPYSRLIQDGKGNLYGTTLGGGGAPGCGIVFELTPIPSGEFRGMRPVFTASRDSRMCVIPSAV